MKCAVGILLISLICELGPGKRRFRRVCLGFCGITLVFMSACYRHADSPGIVPVISGGDLINIPGGTFTRGDMNGDPDEYPESVISLKPFRIERTEVNNGSYLSCINAGVCDPSAYLDDLRFSGVEKPIVGVSWFDALAYCQWIGRRLPTAAEWELAARGRDLRRWPWKGAFDSANANVRGSSDGFETTAPVTAFRGGSSPFGALNMAGNVAEWVADFYDPTYYRSSKEIEDPLGPKTGRERTVKGGGFNDLAFSVRVSARRPKRPTDVAAGIGFRCASDL